MAKVTRPLTKLLQKNQRFNWTGECQEAFEKIKELASEPLQLHRPDFARKFFLQVDASTTGLGAVLFQKDDAGNRQIISYASTTLNKSEQKYHVNELEVYGALFGIRKYRAYLSDNHFTLITDSRSLYWLEKNRDSKAKLTRWSLLLQEYDFDVEHCGGNHNELADFLSRNATTTEDRAFLDEERLLPPEHHKPNIKTQINLLDQPRLYDYVKNKQRESQTIQNSVLSWIEADRNTPRDPQEEAFYRNHVVQDGILYHVRNGQRLLVVPFEALPTIIKQHHDTETAAHPGIRETTRAIQQLYHHNNLLKKVTRYVNNCLICHSVKGRQLQPQGPQRPHTASSPFETISIDVLGPYPTTREKNRFILIVEDLYTKWVEAKATKDAEAVTICAYLEDEIFTRYGYPRTTISDNGTAFHSNRYIRMCNKNHITPYYTAAYQHRQNPVERKVQDFKTTMRALLFRHRNRRIAWDSYIPKALRTQRTRINRATGETPSMALLGYEIALPGQWEIPEFRQRRNNPRDTIAERRRRITERQLNFNRTTFPERNNEMVPTFSVGEQVMVRNYAPTEPFSPAWTGPHPIVEVLSTTMYKVDRNGRQLNYHIDQLRPARPGNEEGIEVEDGEPPTNREQRLTNERNNSSRTIGTRREKCRPAETDVDCGPSTSGQPAQKPERDSGVS